jgi:hypothetical protein
MRPSTPCTPAERITAASITAACADKPVRRIKSTIDIESRPLFFNAVAPASFTLKSQSRTLGAPGDHQKKILAASIAAIKNAIVQGHKVTGDIARCAGIGERTVRRVCDQNPDLFVGELHQVEGYRARQMCWGLVA